MNRQETINKILSITNRYTTEELESIKDMKELNDIKRWCIIEEDYIEISKQTIYPGVTKMIDKNKEGVKISVYEQRDNVLSEQDWDLTIHFIEIVDTYGNHIHIEDGEIKSGKINGEDIYNKRHLT